MAPHAHRVLAAALGLTLVAPGARAAQVPEAPSEAPQEAKAAILPLQVEGELAQADREQLTQAVTDGLARGSFATVAPGEVLAADAGAGSCKREGCFADAAKAAGATHVVHASVEVNDRDYNVEVVLRDGATGKVIAKSAEHCEICGVVDAAALLGTATAVLRNKLDALGVGPATLVLNSKPRGSVVEIDGVVAGVTPFSAPVPPGEHVIRVSHEGHITVERPVTLVEGAEERLSVELSKLPSRLPGRAWGWTTLSVGIAALGYGVGMIFLHDRPFEKECDEAAGTRDARGECRELWDTKWYGLGGTIAGATLTTLGVAILINSPKSKRRKAQDTPSVQAFMRPGGVGVSGRF